MLALDFPDTFCSQPLIMLLASWATHFADGKRLSNLIRPADLVEAVLDPTSLGRNRPELTDTAGWVKRLKAVKGTPDPGSGRRIFFHPNVALCSRCHRHSGRGNVVGPDLSAVAARGEHAWLVESILQPSQQIAPEYLPRLVVLKDGTEFTGIRLRSATYEALRDSNGQTQTFDLTKVESIRDMETSFMPEGLVYSLTDRELRDLVAFLETSIDTKRKP